MQAQMQLQPPVEASIQELAESGRWHHATSIAFRFFFAYFALYIIPFPLDALPFTGFIVQKYTDLWHWVVPWVGKHVLHLSYDITVFQNGSGDTTYNYVRVFCLLALAAAATLIWSVLDRRRRGYEELHKWLRLYVRFSLASAMISRNTLSTDERRQAFNKNSRLSV